MKAQGTFKYKNEGMEVENRQVQTELFFNHAHKVGCVLLSLLFCGEGSLQVSTLQLVMGM